MRADIPRFSGDDAAKRAHADGRKAFLAGIPRTAVPRALGVHRKRRSAWVAGWDAERALARAEG